jgi:Tol biopolymer transport system component
VAGNISSVPANIVGTVIRQNRFSVSDTGTLIHWTGSGQKEHLAWFDRSGKQLETVSPFSRMRGVSLTPDGQHIAVGMADFYSGDLWLLDETRGTSSRLTFEGDNYYPVFSPDGSRVAFSSDRAGVSMICQKAANGSGAEEKLLEIKERVFLSDWSHDGRFLTYAVQGRELTRDIWVLPLDRDRKPFPFLKTAANENFLRFSPDGKWMSYQSDESGKDQVYVMPFSPGAGGSGKWQISVEGGVGGRWRGDGKELFYLEGRKLMAVEVSVVGGSFHAGIPKMLFETRMTSLFYWVNYTPSADGRRFLIAVPVEQEAGLPITVVMNWMAGLKR